MTLARFQFNVVADMGRSSPTSPGWSGGTSGHRPRAVDTTTASGGARGGGPGLRTTAQCLDELTPEVVVEPAVQ